LRISGEETALRQRHACWFLDLAERAERTWRAHHETDWLDRLDADLDNLRAALSWFAECGSLEIALRLVGAVHHFWLVRGFWQEGRTTAEKLLASAGSGLPRLARAKALRVVGTLATWQGDEAAARALLDESLGLFQAERDPGAATAWLDVGVAASFRSDRDVELMAFEEALALGRKVGDEVVVYRALYHLGEAARSRGDFEHARALNEESLNISARYGDTRNHAFALVSLGRLAWMQAEYAQAVALHRDSLRLWRDRRDQGRIAISMEGLAWAVSGQGQDRRAVRLFGAVERLRETCGCPLPSSFRNPHEQSVTAVRTRLGAAAFRSAWAAGRALSLEEIMAEALEEDECSTSQEAKRAAASGASGPLSRREREVAALIARGCTNSQIGRKLVITEATAAKHIEHILDKLGLSSRAQVAVWVTQHGLLAGAPG
jgi:DNA-binding CsgD family transcriptional regulator